MGIDWKQKDNKHWQRSGEEERLEKGWFHLFGLVLIHFKQRRRQRIHLNTFRSFLSQPTFSIEKKQHVWSSRWKNFTNRQMLIGAVLEWRRMEFVLKRMLLMSVGSLMPGLGCSVKWIKRWKWLFGSNWHRSTNQLDGLGNQWAMCECENHSNVGGLSRINLTA